MGTEKRIPSALPLQYRTAKIDAQPEEGKRLSGPDPGRFSLALTSEEPVRRWFGDEILMHGKENVRTDRLKSGMVPLLFNHDPSQHLGAVDKYELKDGVLRVSGPFGNSPLAQEKRRDYDDGILKGASGGYKVHKMVRTVTEDGDGEEDPETAARCEVRDWEPFDASLVTIPADYTVGAGRSDDAKNFPVEIETILQRGDGTDAPSSEGRSEAPAVTPVNPVPAADEPLPAAQEPQPKPQEIRTMAEAAVVPNAAELEIARRNEIMAVATDKDFRKYVTIDEAQRAIADNVSASVFKDGVTRKIIDANDVAQVGTAGDAVFNNLSGKEKKRYSVLRLLRSLVNEAKPGTFEKNISDASMEREVGKEIRRNLKVPTNGPLVPVAALRTLGTQTVVASGGQLGLTTESATVETITRPEVIEMLRHRPRCVQLGARTMGGLQGVVRLPRQDTAGTWQWVGEGASTTPTDLTADFISITPHRGSSQTSWTIELLAESAPDVEALARADMEKYRNLALDLAALTGSGTGGAPLGLLNTTGLVTLNPSGTAFADGGQPLIFSDVLSFEKLVSAADADAFTSAWMFTPEVRAQLKGTPKFPAGLADPIWQQGPRDPLGLEEGPLGYRAGVTNQLPKNGTKAGVTGSILHAGVFGDWSQLVFADWGAVEFVVDPYTQAGAGAIVVTQRSLHDIAIRHIAAFAASLTIAIS